MNSRNNRNFNPRIMQFLFLMFFLIGFATCASRRFETEEDANGEPQIYTDAGS